jgi:tRNA nucleotidyltransferase (CCA-adding enzyme)
MPTSEQPIEALRSSLIAAHPALAKIRDAAEQPVYLVGGAVRDLLLQRPSVDLDLLVDGDAGALAERLGGGMADHDRFGTAKVLVDGVEVDLTSARTESYSEPGALPEVVLGASLEEDLGRRDFTINAMAVPLAGEARLIDPYGGRADLDAGLLRVLHAGSFLDDPTRALRAARYGARFGFALEVETERLLRETDLGTISEDRLRSELRRLAAEEEGPRGLGLLGSWGLLELRPGGVELAERALAVLAAPLWRGAAPREEVVLGAAVDPPGREAELAAARPQRPSEAASIAAGRPAVELVLARALGAEWLDPYRSEWSVVRLEIDGGDLRAAGIPEGPGIGRALEATLRAKRDGEVAGRGAELAMALELARRP